MHSNSVMAQNRDSPSRVRATNIHRQCCNPIQDNPHMPVLRTDDFTEGTMPQSVFVLHARVRLASSGVQSNIYTLSLSVPAFYSDPTLFDKSFALVARLIEISARAVLMYLHVLQLPVTLSLLERFARNRQYIHPWQERQAWERNNSEAVAVQLTHRPVSGSEYRSDPLACRVSL